jgi:MFS transporter, NNP family, nitrate/nitrite transporter
MSQRSTARDANAILTLSTVGFTLMFAVWLMFGVLAIPIRDEFDLSEEQFGWLTAIAILNGALWRLAFGVLADRYGGRRVFTLLVLATAVPSFLVSQATTYAELMIYAFLLGMAGNAFSVGVSWNSAWFPAHRKGFALGVFGAGNVGASVTKFIGPALIVAVPAAGLGGGMIPGGWRFVPFLYSVLLVLMAAAMWLGTPPVDRVPGKGRPIGEMLAPLRTLRVWRFSLYYVAVFGAYIALSVWLPRHYVDIYGLSLQTAALLTALFIFPASLLRPFGGWLSDRFGARTVMYAVFSGMTLALLFLSAPEGHIVIYATRPDDPDRTYEIMQFVMGPWPFTILIFIVGIGMGVGKAAVYKYIPEYFPDDVGAVGGLVGMLGALGGFFLPPLFSYLWLTTGLPQSPFFVLFLLSGGSLVWLHLVVHRMMREAAPHLRDRFEHPPEPEGAPSRTS